MSKRIGVLLSGCGHRDGSEVHEAALTLLALDLAGAEAACFAPSGAQRFVRNHLTGADEGGRRDILIESARIARGKVRDIKEARAEELSGLVIPGGTGAGTNLSTFLIEGAACSVNADAVRLIRDVHRAGKPIGAICIAPAALARVLQEIGSHATMTIGTDASVARQIEGMGHRHEDCEAAGCIVDREKKIVTTPAYMNAKGIGEVWEGVRKLVAAVMEMA